MITIHFSTSEAERKALAFLAGRFAFKTCAGGRTLVPEAALSHLAVEGISFTVEGPAAYEQSISTVRDSSSAPVQ